MRRIWPVVLLLGTAAAHAGNRPLSVGPIDMNLLNRPLGSSPAIVLYFSHTIGGGGGGGLSKPAVGLRLDRMHLVSGNFKPDSPNAMQTRELINWHFGHGANNRIELGRRVSWNLGNQTFGRRGGDESAFTLPGRAALALREPVASPAPSLRTVDPNPLTIEPMTLARRMRSAEPLEARTDPFELRLERRTHEPRSGR